MYKRQEQVDGGQEVSQAAYLAYEASRPVTGTASKGAAPVSYTHLYPEVTVEKMSSYRKKQ